MTGIEELRHLAQRIKTKSTTGYVTVVANHHAIELEMIADQIERELREERDRWDEELCEAQMDKTRVMAVYLEMNKHVSGVEGAEDSPVARWARELREALKSDASDGSDGEKPSCPGCHDAADATFGGRKVTRDPAEDVSMSAYDLLSSDERNAIAWVRDHGGIESVKEAWNHRNNLDRQLETAKAKVERQQRHIEFVQGKCHERLVRIAELNKTIADMRPRLMPEGMEWLVEEWPRFEDDALVCIEDEIRWRDEGGVVNSIELQDGGYFILHVADGADDWIHPQYFPGERVKRPAKVLDADGAEIRVGDELYGPQSGNGPFVVEAISGDGELHLRAAPSDCRLLGAPDAFTHRAPVLAADGRPLREGETVWYRDHIDPLEVRGISTTESGAQYVKAYNDYEGEVSAPAEDFTHERTIADTWERLEEDADALAEAEINGEGSFNAANDYCERHGLKDGTVWVLVAQDLVRRAKALAERDA